MWAEVPGDIDVEGVVAAIATVRGSWTGADQHDLCAALQANVRQRTRILHTRHAGTVSFAVSTTELTASGIAPRGEPCCGWAANDKVSEETVAR
jgi:hypothetical protein